MLNFCTNKNARGFLKPRAFNFEEKGVSKYLFLNFYFLIGWSAQAETV